VTHILVRRALIWAVGGGAALWSEAVQARLSPRPKHLQEAIMNGTRINGGARRKSVFAGAAMVALLATPATGQEVAPRPALTAAVQVTANPTR